MADLRRFASLGLIAVAALGVSGCSAAGTADDDARVTGDDGYYGTVVTGAPVTLPDAALIDEQGRSVELREQVRAPVTLMTFAYTSCPDECPLSVSSVAAAVRGLSAAEREAVDVVVLSADPATDTPEVLRRWLARFDDSFRGLTGNAQTLERVAARLYIPLEVPAAAGTGSAERDVAHGVQIWAFGRDKEALLVWGGTPTPSQLRADVARLVGAQREDG